MKILVAFDFSPHSYKALRFAAKLAKALNVNSIDVVILVPDNTKVGLSDEARRRIEREAEGIHVNLRLERYSSITSSAVNEIMRLIVEEGYNMLVVGAKGLSLREDTSIGSTALWLAAFAPITVVIVR